MKTRNLANYFQIEKRLSRLSRDILIKLFIKKLFQEAMIKNNSSFNPNQVQNAKSEKADDSSQGIKERLLKKYRQSKTLRLIDGNMKDAKKDIAA